MEALKQRVKAAFHADSRLYNGLAWSYGWLAGKPSVRRAAYMRWFKDSRFREDEIWMATSLPTHMLDAILDRWQPRSFLDVGCGVGNTLVYVAAKGLDCLGLEGSRPAIAASAVKHLIREVDLNHPIDLERKFDLVWSVERSPNTSIPSTRIPSWPLSSAHGERLA